MRIYIVLIGLLFFTFFVSCSRSEENDEKIETSSYQATSMPDAVSEGESGYFTSLTDDELVKLASKEFEKVSSAISYLNHFSFTVDFDNSIVKNDEIYIRVSPEFAKNINDLNLYYSQYFAENMKLEADFLDEFIEDNGQLYVLKSALNPDTTYEGYDVGYNIPEILNVTDTLAEFSITYLYIERDSDETESFTFDFSLVYNNNSVKVSEYTYLFSVDI